MKIEDVAECYVCADEAPVEYAYEIPLCEDCQHLVGRRVTRVVYEPEPVPELDLKDADFNFPFSIT